MGRPSEPGTLHLAMPSSAERHSPTDRRPSQQEACSGVKVEQMLLNSDSQVAASVGSEVNKPELKEEMESQRPVMSGDSAITLSVQK